MRPTISIGVFLKKIIWFLCTFGAALSCSTLWICLLKGVLTNTSQICYFGLFSTDLPSVIDNSGTHIAWFPPKWDSNRLYRPSIIFILSQPNPTPTQQQLNLTRLRLDSMITPNPPPHPHKLSKPAVVTLVTAWRQHYISLMWGWYQTV